MVVAMAKPDEPIKGYSVHREVLHESAQASIRIAEDFHAGIDEHHSTVVGAVDGHSGWEFPDALSETADAWAAHLHGHAAQIHVIGLNLHKNHANYTEAEDVTRARARAVAGTTEV
jgi:hypothetical protein